MIRFRHKGDFSKSIRFLEKAKKAAYLGDLDKFGRAGVAALASATPVDSGETATSWYYEITNKNNVVTISFHNSIIQNGVPIAIILQYGHGTGTGGWVQGRDYINPAIQPIFDQIANYAWKEVTRSLAGPSTRESSRCDLTTGSLSKMCKPVCQHSTNSNGVWIWTVLPKALRTWAPLRRSAICPPLAVPSRRFGRSSRRLKSLP